MSTGFLIELTQITSGDYQVVRKPPEGTVFVYHATDSLHCHVRSPECFIVQQLYEKSYVLTLSFVCHRCVDVEVFSEKSWLPGVGQSADTVVL